MTDFKHALARTPVLGRAALLAYRSKAALHHLRWQSAYLVRWLIRSRETTNYTYDLEASNKRYLVSLLSDIVNVRFDQMMSYISEIEDDQELRRHIQAATAGSNYAFVADNEVRYATRLGWYAITRATKPRVVVETGVDKGLGSCVLAAALKKNKEEGHEGYYFGTDINRKAGYLLSGVYADYGRILYGDSIESLKSLNATIDLFINDSDHSAEYEAEEYKTIADRLADDAIILGDNSHATSQLLDFSLATNRHFVFFQEKPNEHWYPGGGMGISFRRKVSPSGQFNT